MTDQTLPGIVLEDIRDIEDDVPPAPTRGRDGEPPQPRRDGGKENGRGGFFTIDLDGLYSMADQGVPIEELAAFLALAVNTGADNISSRGGRNSLQSYLGLGPVGAEAALRGLVDRGFILPLADPRSRSLTLPRYGLPCPCLRPVRVPNGFVRATGGTSSLCRLMQAGSIQALLLALRFFEESLGGHLPARVLHRPLPVTPLGSLGNRSVLRVGMTGEPEVVACASLRPRHPDLCADLRLLEDLGVIEWAPMLHRPGPGPTAIEAGRPLPAWSRGQPDQAPTALRLGLLGQLAARLVTGTGEMPPSLDALRQDWLEGGAATVLAPVGRLDMACTATIRMADPFPVDAGARATRATGQVQLSDELAQVLIRQFPATAGIVADIGALSENGGRPG